MHNLQTRTKVIHKENKRIQKADSSKLKKKETSLRKKVPIKLNCDIENRKKVTHHERVMLVASITNVVCPPAKMLEGGGLN